MKKAITFLLALVMVFAMVGCSAKETEKVPLTAKLEGIVDEIYETQPIELNVVTMPVDITDTEWSLKSYTGLSSGEKIKEAVASESMIGSIPYSLVLVRVNDAADARAVAEEMKAGIDTRKWICVEADDLMVSGYCDVIMLVMVGSEYAQSGLTAQAITDAFAGVCGGELDFTI